MAVKKDAQWRDVLTVGRTDANIVADVAEDLPVAKLIEGQFKVIGWNGRRCVSPGSAERHKFIKVLTVSEKVLQSVQGCTELAVRLELVRLSAVYVREEQVSRQA